MEEKKAQRFDLSTALGVLIISLIFGGIFLLLWKKGLFGLEATKSGVQIIGALLGLFGVLATATVALIGYLIKRSFDAHSLRLQETTERRLTLEAEQSRKRLDLETAIRAVSLMTTSDGTEAPLTQRSGALFALVTLEQLDLALALIDNMWPQSGVDPGTAVWVIDKALQSSMRRHQIEATSILRKDPARLYDDTGGIYWPESMYLTWKKDIDVRSRELILDTLVRVLIGRPKNQWGEGYLWEIASILQNIIRIDEEPRIRAGAILAQESLLLSFAENYSGEVTILSALGPVTLDAMRNNKQAFEQQMGFAAQEAVTSDVMQGIKQLEKWATGQMKTTHSRIHAPLLD